MCGCRYLNMKLEKYKTGKKMAKTFLIIFAFLTVTDKGKLIEFL
jgi:hypothetical protein